MPRPLHSTALFIALAAGLLALSGCNTGNAHLGLVGKSAPVISIPGEPTDSLQALRGRIVVLNFWASWCPPCLEEFPSLAALQQQMPGITVLAVSFDRDPAAYQSFLSRHPFAVHMALDPSGRSNEAFGTTMPPETFILDKNGIVRRKFIGAQDWTSPEIVSYLQALRSVPRLRRSESRTSAETHLSQFPAAHPPAQSRQIEAAIIGEQ